MSASQVAGIDPNRGQRAQGTGQSHLALDPWPFALNRPLTLDTNDTLDPNDGFPCERCGVCCRRVGTVPIAKDIALPSGVCKYLDEETNLCRIYSTRPIFCNVDAYYDKYLSNIMTREDFYKRNKEACRRMQSQ